MQQLLLGLLVFLYTTNIQAQATPSTEAVTVTVINELIDKNWVPFLQTPPFPEYTSGHSTITASASVVLAHLYGNTFAFQDTSDLRYIGLQRHFNSFQEAAAEASVSRVYGGIHYRNSVDVGAEAGKKVGNNIIDKVLK